MDGTVWVQLHPGRHDQGSDGKLGVEAAGDTDDHQVIERAAGENALGRLPGHLGSHPNHCSRDRPRTDRAVVGEDIVARLAGEPPGPHHRLELGSHRRQYRYTFGCPHAPIMAARTAP